MALNARTVLYSRRRGHQKMEDFPRQILVENFRECLRVYELYIAWAIAASFSCLLLSLRMKRAASATSPPQPQQPPASVPSGILPSSELMSIRIPVLFGDVSVDTAWVIAIGLYFLLGIFALRAIERALSLINAFPPDIACALAQYPSVATEENVVLRLGAVLLPSALTVAAVTIEAVRERRALWSDKSSWLGGLIILVIIFAPYVGLARCAISPIKANCMPTSFAATSQPSHSGP